MGKLGLSQEGNLVCVNAGVQVWRGLCPSAGPSGAVSVTATGVPDARTGNVLNTGTLGWPSPECLHIGLCTGGLAVGIQLWRRSFVAD